MAILLLLAGGIVGYFVYYSENVNQDLKPFSLGLDLSGGSYLVYEADTSTIENNEIDASMEALRDVIERRVNLFGVSEPSVTTEVARLGGVDQHRLVVELPGVTDIDEAIAKIGETPVLEFKLVNPEFQNAVSAAFAEANIDGENMEVDLGALDLGEQYIETGLTGRYLTAARVEFSQGGGSYGGIISQPLVAIDFDKEGGELFAEITRDNIGQQLAIFLDGEPISSPVIESEIPNGSATITGNFSAEEAKQLAGRLSSGALPIEISLVNTQTIGPSLGHNAIDAGVKAGMLGLLFVIVFMLIYYRVAGLMASLALAVYAVIMLTLFKVIPVTLTSAGIAGFIISLGIAVDANVLIFERLKEEMNNGRNLHDAIEEGFIRAWPSIRDSNLSSLISSVILFWFGTSLIQGFALTFGLGVLVSMMSAIVITRSFLFGLAGRNNGRVWRWLFSPGFYGSKIDNKN